MPTNRSLYKNVKQNECLQKMNSNIKFYYDKKKTHLKMTFKSTKNNNNNQYQNKFESKQRFLP